MAKSDILIPKCTEGGYLKFINQESSCTLNDTKNIWDMSAIYLDFTKMQHWCWVCTGKLQWTKMNEYKIRWITKDKSGQKGENTERQYFH